MFITGTLIILTSYIMEPVLACLHNRQKYKTYAYLEWISNSSLQLHRQAHEGLGLTKWSKCTDLVPTTDPTVVLTSLDITDVEHPILGRSLEKEKSEATALQNSEIHDSSQNQDTHTTRQQLSQQNSMNSTVDQVQKLDDSAAISYVSSQLTPVDSVIGETCDEMFAASIENKARQPMHGEGGGDCSRISSGTVSTCGTMSEEITVVGTQ